MLQCSLPMLNFSISVNEPVYCNGRSSCSNACPYGYERDPYTDCVTCTCSKSISNGSLFLSFSCVLSFLSPSLPYMFVNKIISAFYAQESSLINGLSVLFFYQGVGPISPHIFIHYFMEVHTPCFQ